MRRKFSNSRSHCVGLTTIEESALCAGWAPKRVFSSCSAEANLSSLEDFQSHYDAIKILLQTQCRNAIERSNHQFR